MNVWHKNIENKITTLWVGANPTLVVEYKLESTIAWTNIGTPSHIGDNLYSVNHTFINNGNYMIRVRDTETGVGIFDKLEVQDKIDFEGKFNTMEEFIRDTNYKVSNMLKRWIKRGI